MENETLEQEARRLRDLIYSHNGKEICTDEQWQRCKDFWIADIEALRAYDMSLRPLQLKSTVSASPIVEKNINEKFFVKRTAEKAI